MSAMPIEKLECWILRIPTIRSHTLSVATMSEQRLVILKLTDTAGNIGLGEATTIGNLAYTDESPDSIKLHIDLYFRSFLIGKTPEPKEVMPAINGAIVGNYFAKSAVETALFDLKGRQLGVSVSELLGGKQKNSLSVAWTLASGDTERDIEEGWEILNQRRHRLFKLKIGKRCWQDDVQHVVKIAEAFGNKASIRVDLNQAWSFEDAKRAIPVLYEAGVGLIEQPLKYSDLEGSRTLCDISSPSIMADEALRGGPAAAALVIKEKAADVLSLKIAQAGGLRNCKEVALMGLRSNLGLYGGTMLEGGVGTVASAQLFSTLPDFAWGTELFGPLLLTQDVLQEPLKYQDFELELPKGPGLGITLNADAVQEFVEVPVH